MKHKVDVLVVGSGAAGLFTAKAMTELGLKVAVIELRKAYSAGATATCEGWLHPGTYHSQSIADPEEAARVAQRCKYGSDLIRMFAPEAIDFGQRTFAVLKNGSNLGYVLDRWKESEIPFKPVTSEKIRKFFPNLKANEDSAYFETTDRGVNTRMLATKLLSYLSAAGVQLHSDAEIDSVDGNCVEFVKGGARHQIQASFIIYTVGAGAQSLARRLYNFEIPLRYWKSHLIISPKVADHSLYCLDPGEMTMINHSGTSVFGFNNDAVQVLTPEYTIDPDKVLLGLAAIERTIPLHGHSHHDAIACIKVDLCHSIGSERSIGVSEFEIGPNHFFAWPGKMSEAPFLASELTRRVFERLNPSSAAKRPCDRSFTLSKQGVRFEDGAVVKPVSSEAHGLHQIEVATAYRINPRRPVKVIEHQVVVAEQTGGWQLRMPAIEHLTLSVDFQMMRELVLDLAAFHATFASPSEAVVLYRDAIIGNYLQTPDGICHIDFASCDKWVHGFDDLALLLCPAWVTLSAAEVDELVAVYIRSRRVFIGETAHALPLIKNDAASLIHYYSESIVAMDRNGFESRNLLNFVDKINLCTLQPVDFRVFKAYREVRAEWYKKCVWGKAPALGRD